MKTHRARRAIEGSKTVLISLLGNGVVKRDQEKMELGIRSSETTGGSEGPMKVQTGNERRTKKMEKLSKRGRAKNRTECVREMICSLKYSSSPSMSI